MDAEHPGGPTQLDTERMLRAICASLDGEGPPVPEDAGDDVAGSSAAAFRDTALRLRQAVRVQAADAPPDLTEAVMAEVARSRRTGARAERFGRRQVGLVAAIAFLATAVLTSMVMAPGWRGGRDLAAADVGEQLLAAQRGVSALDATVVLIEQGAHPDLLVRRYEGSLRYRAPEQLWLSLRDVSARPAGWPANDIDLLIDDGQLITTGLRSCPVGAQPACLTGPDTRSVVGIPPFAEDVQAPLDLIIPVGGLMPDAATHIGDAAAQAPDRTPGGQVTVGLTVAQVQPLVDALTGTGAMRQLHPSDPVSLRMDADGLGLRSLSVRAAGGDGRATWAAANGYADRPGDPLLDLQLTPTTPIALPSSVGHSPPTADAGFVDDPAPAPVRATDLPEGFTVHRSGHLRAGGPLTEVIAYSDGRAWVRVDATAAWTAPMLFGDLGALVRPVAVGQGTGYTTPEGDAVGLRGGTWDVVVSGSVPLEVLVEVAASLTEDGEPVVGRLLPDDWPQAQLLTELPAGALAPDGPLTARGEGGGRIVVAVPGAGGGGARLVQQPTTVAPPPVKADVVEVEVRGVPGRWSPPLGQLVWFDDGWSYELTSEGHDLDGLLEIAEALS